MKDPNKYELGYIGRFMLGMVCGAVVSATVLFLYELGRYLSTH